MPAALAWDEVGMTFGCIARPRDPRLKAVVLDWFGTTVDFGCCAPATALGAVFQREGVELSAAETRQIPGLSVREQLWALAKSGSIASRWRAARGSYCGEDDVQRMLSHFSEALAACAGRFAEPVPGAVDVVRALRVRGLAIGSTTEFDARVMAVVAEAAAHRGYQPDCIVNASEVPEGRPAPWMCWECARRLNVYPAAAMVKVDDTVQGIEEGVNAGLWTVAVAATGREIGLTPREAVGLSRAEFDGRLKDARARLRAAGAHFVIDSLAEFLPCLDAIEKRRAAGERP